MSWKVWSFYTSRISTLSRKTAINLKIISNQTAFKIKLLVNVNSVDQEARAIGSCPSSPYHVVWHDGSVTWFPDFTKTWDPFLCLWSWHHSFTFHLQFILILSSPTHFQDSPQLWLKLPNYKTGILNKHDISYKKKKTLFYFCLPLYNLLNKQQGEFYSCE